MPTPANHTAHEGVVDAYRAYLRAMIDGDINALEDPLDEGSTLTHITGYVQPKTEWLAQMRAGQFDYHTARENDLSIDVDDDPARLVGRIITDATEYWTRANWRLPLTMDYARPNGSWTALRAVATTW